MKLSTCCFFNDSRAPGETVLLKSVLLKLLPVFVTGIPRFTALEEIRRARVPGEFEVTLIAIRARKLFTATRPEARSRKMWANYFRSTFPPADT